MTPHQTPAPPSLAPTVHGVEPQQAHQRDEETPGRFRPEILAPAGNPEMLKAAVENGADAVYFGLQEFNARLRARNFALDELPGTISWLHERGVRAYVTLNTLIFPDELELSTELLRACSRAGVDAVLLQDLGVAALARQLVPDLPLHASTQMTMTSAEGIEALEAVGLKLDRVVAARELSRRELAKLRAVAAAEIEVFIHGALCVAYSGQCLTSEALGGRSANRGECAQACRLPYGLVVDGEARDMGDVRYLLSPKDLCALEDIPDLMRLGIVSLKIEGRYKSPEYVAATVAAYRDAIDAAMEGVQPKLEGAVRQRLEMVFSRGLSGAYLHEINHQEVVEGRYSGKRGLLLGKVERVDAAGITIGLGAPLTCGDGVMFEPADPEEKPEGGRVFAMRVGRHEVKSAEPPAGKQLQRVQLVFGRSHINASRIKPGALVWKTSDPRLERELRNTFDGDAVRFRRPVKALVTGAVGVPLALELWDWEGNHVEVLDSEPAELAREHALSAEVLGRQLGRMGNSPFRLGELEVRLQGDVMVPVSRLNDLRRRAVDALCALRRELHRQRREQPEALDVAVAEVVEHKKVEANPPRHASTLSVLCRTLEQVEAAVAHGKASTIYTDFEDIRRHIDARRLIPAESGIVFAPATLRIMKPGEAGFMKAILKAEPDAMLVRNLGAWMVARREAPELPLVGDFSLNIANQLTASLFWNKFGIKLLTPSYDLNIDQLSHLIEAAPSHWFEVTIHQYMPMFHMEHCVFCRFLSNGTDHTNCGRPCDQHHLELSDRVGTKHTVKADAGCRNTVFNGMAQSACEYIGRLLELGVRRFRVDLLNERAADVGRVLDAYLPVVRGEASGHKLWKRLHATARLGVTRGSLDHE
jgi:putative protease